MIRICPEVAFEVPWGGFSVVYVCKEDFDFGCKSTLRFVMAVKLYVSL